MQTLAITGGVAGLGVAGLKLGGEALRGGIKTLGRNRVRRTRNS